MPGRDVFPQHVAAFLFREFEQVGLEAAGGRKLLVNFSANKAS